MSHYIADRLHLLKNEIEEKSFHRAFNTNIPEFTKQAIADVRSDVALLDGRELFAFARSALNAAADLRIDTPQRLDRLAAAVLSKPRQLFIETHGPDRSLVAGNLRGFLPVKAQSGDRQHVWVDIGSPHSKQAQIEGYGERWGVFIDVLGHGKARFRSVYTRPKHWARGMERYRDIDTMVEMLPKPMKSATRRAFSFDFSPHWYTIDIGRHVGMSKQEFSFAVERMAKGADPILDNAKDKLSEASGPREKASIIDAAWRLSRFRDLIREEPLQDDQKNSVMRNLSSSLMSHKALSLPDGVTLVALLAVLEAESSDILKTPRKEQIVKGPKKTSKTASKARRPIGGLSVVTLNLEDNELNDIYKNKASTGMVQPANSVNAGTGRARHPVRGHLFMGRGGKLVWRSPHWRGNLDKAQIKRVIAPSH